MALPPRSLFRSATSTWPSAFLLARALPALWPEKALNRLSVNEDCHADDRSVAKNRSGLDLARGEAAALPGRLWRRHAARRADDGPHRGAAGRLSSPRRHRTGPPRLLLCRREAPRP